MNMISLFTDGSGDRKYFGAYAWVLTSGMASDEHIFDWDCRGSKNVTSNQMELKAVIEGLKGCRKSFAPLVKDLSPDPLVALPTHTKIGIYSDSAYVINCLNDKWYRGWIASGWIGSSGPVKNVDYWKELLVLANHMVWEGFDLTWNHVRGHRDTYWNNWCDKMAGAKRKEIINSGE